MAIKRRLKEVLNRHLAGFNLRLETLSRDRREAERMEHLIGSGHFDRPTLTVPRCFADASIQTVLDAVREFRDGIAGLAGSNPVGFQRGNRYFDGYDAEVLYAVVRRFRPRRVVEIGSGNSTKVSRLAVLDGKLTCEIVCVDPQPRTDISAFADVVHRTPVEQLDLDTLQILLAAGDILFIDSSHEVRPGNDVTFIFGQLLPRVPAGVLVHVHDIFIPYEYPLAWIAEMQVPWGEQALVHAMLEFGSDFRVLWPGHYVQRTTPDLAGRFGLADPGVATSLWLEKIR